jgi:6-phosphogluconate dehydrogenase
MSTRRNDIGVVGLGVMGANLARNLARRGHRVAGYDQSPEAARRLAEAHPEAKLYAVTSYEQLVESLEPPRRVLVMVPAGAPVDAVLDALDPLLGPDDVVVDGGNSLFADTDRRNERAAKRPWRFVGMGVSGGAEGALEGPSLMPGGDREAWERLRPLLESIAAVSDAGPCVTWCGYGSAGHFVKMVHNGIEYGDMQLIAETALLLRRGLGLEPPAVADTFAAWNEDVLESFLIEITAQIFRFPDPQDENALLLDAILDSAGQKGTGRWTVQAALDLGVAVPTLAAAVDARVLSAGVALRRRAEQAFRTPDTGCVSGVSVEDLRDALYAAKLASYAQGFALLAAGSAEHAYQTDLSEIARIWKAGCIIRARLLDAVRAAVADEPASLILAPALRAEVAKRVPAWRRVVAAAVAAGLPAPGLGASLGWFDTLTTARGSAALIQAQRDHFGSHTYERIDNPGKPVHTDWTDKP